MAVVRYRYRKTYPNVDLSYITQRVGATPAIVGQSQGQLIDVDIDTAIDNIADLTEVMTKLGYAYVQGPGVTGTPGDAAEFVRRTGDTMTGNLTMSGGATVTGLPTAVNPTEAISLAQLQATVISGRIWREALLVKEQLLSGGAGGILQAELAAFTAALAVGDLFKISDGTTTETWTGIAVGPPAAFQFVVGVSAAADQAALVAAINNDSTLWSAIETSGLDDYFAGAPASQFVVYRTAVSTNPDRIFGTIAGGQSGIKVVEFATGDQDYVSAAGTESDLPAADPAAKRFGFGRLFAGLISVETHFIVEDNSQWTWDEDDDIWRMTGGTSSGSAPLCFGADDVLSSTTVRYLFPWYSDQTAQVTAVEIRMPRNGTVKNMRVRHNIAGAAATVITYTFVVNTVGTALSVGLAANANDGSNLANSVAVSANDRVTVAVTKAATIVGNKPHDIEVSFEFTS